MAKQTVSVECPCCESTIKITLECAKKKSTKPPYVTGTTQRDSRLTRTIGVVKGLSKSQIY
jgi:hypothetical protein